MKRTYGTRLQEIPPGFVARVVFPQMAMMDQRTGDGRLLMSDGGGTRSLPRPIRFVREASSGHMGAVTSGRLDYVELREDGTVYGEGFLLNDPNGREHARLIATKAMDGNSVDLAEVEVEVDIDWDKMEIQIDFTKWAIAATTGVGTPAFADARAELDGGDFELIADASGEIVVIDESGFGVIIREMNAESEMAELTAACALATGELIAEYADFSMPEATEPTKVVVTEDGRVYGHLALWDSCHVGIVGSCATAPRSATGYSHFCKAGVLTDKGQIETGPISLVGGHHRGLRPEDIDKAYGGIENAWADVVAVDGELGIWISGRVRPGTSAEKIYAARASRISGHWLNGELYAIVSVSAEGFNVPGSGKMSFTTGSNNEVLELIASYDGCADPADSDIGDRAAAVLLDMIDG